MTDVSAVSVLDFRSTIVEAVAVIDEVSCAAVVDCDKVDSLRAVDSLVSEVEENANVEVSVVTMLLDC